LVKFGIILPVGLVCTHQVFYSTDERLFGWLAFLILKLEKAQAITNKY